MKEFGTPALFITINPSDIHNPLVGVMAGMSPEKWRSMDTHSRGAFVAKNPCLASLFFDYTIKHFVSMILHYGDAEGGLFGKCSTYYGMVEAQGRGTLHCHMLIWIEGNLNPQELRDRMRSDSLFKGEMSAWLKSIIHCELPGTMELQPTGCDEAPKPKLKLGDDDPRTLDGPQLQETPNSKFEMDFQDTICVILQ